MLTAIAAIVIGLVALTWSADHFVTGAAAAARNMNVSKILIGLTVVSIGTSAPEILVSAIAALEGYSQLAVGNVIGSNITNIGLVLGATALIARLPVNRSLTRRELPMLFAVTLLAGVLIANGVLGQIDGLILLAGLLLVLWLMIHWQKDAPEEDTDDFPVLSPLKAWLVLLTGLALLLGSSQLLVWGATTVAELLGISELVIGLTIVAIGTSLPELAASVTSAVRGHHEIALGNVIGSNLFNLLCVLPVPALFAPGPLDQAVFARDYPAMLALTMLLLFCLIGKWPRTLGRWVGVLLLTAYCCYALLLFRQHS